MVDSGAGDRAASTDDGAGVPDAGTAVGDGSSSGGDGVGAGDGTEPVGSGNRGALGRLVLGILVLLLGLYALGLAVDGIRLTVENRSGIFFGPGTGFRQYVSWPRLVVFVVSLAVLGALLVVGGWAVSRYRRGPASRRGRGPTPLTRWSVRTALVVTGWCFVGVAVLIVAGDISVGRHGGGPPTAVLVGLSIAGTVCCAAVLVGVVRVLRSAPFRARPLAVLVLAVVAAGLLSAPYLVTGHVTRGEQFADDGFNVAVPAPDPRIAPVVTQTCGDATHCLAVGPVGGLGGSVPALGLATTADGGASWRAVYVEGLQFDHAYRFSCAGSACWGMAAVGGGPPGGSTSIVSVAIGPSGWPDVSTHASGAPPYGPTRCVSALQCVAVIGGGVGFDPASRSRTVSLPTTVSTSDGGAIWTTRDLPGIAPRYAGTSDQTPGIPWCDAGGSCVMSVDVEPVPCRTALVCPSTVLMYRSTDGGGSWTAGGALPAGFVALVCTSPPTCTALSAPSVPAGRRPQVAVSPDLGQTWGSPVQLPSGLDGTVSCATTGRCIAVDSVVATAEDGVRLSDDDAVTWGPLLRPPVKPFAVGVQCAPGGTCQASYQSMWSSGVVPSEFVGSSTPQGGWHEVEVPRPRRVVPGLN